MLGENRNEKYPILSKAPISEALIDIQVKLPPNVDINALDFHDEIKSKYPTRQELRRYEGGFEIKDGKPQPVKDFVDSRGGFRYISADGRFILQSRMDGFTLSRVHKYETWQEFIEEGQSLWNIYNAKVSPMIIRVALRYINTIRIPFPVNDFGDYFTTPPILPKDLPQGVSSFFNRIMIYEPSIGVNAVITNAMEPIVNQGIVPIILDIDVFKSKPEGFSERDAWESLEEIRVFKNKIFYNLITDKLMEMLR